MILTIVLTNLTLFPVHLFFDFYRLNKVKFAIIMNLKLFTGRGKDENLC